MASQGTQQANTLRQKPATGTTPTGTPPGTADTNLCETYRRNKPPDTALERRINTSQKHSAAGITGPFPQLTKQTEQHITMKDSGRQQHHLKEKDRANWPLTLRSE
jgi:hypothetical protein